MIAHIFYVGVLSIWLYCSSAMTQEVLHPDRFVFGVKGTGTCSDGEVIMDKETCETACRKLNIPQKTLLGNFKCYKDGQGFCYQDGQNGGGASIICRKSEKTVDDQTSDTEEDGNNGGLGGTKQEWTCDDGEKIHITRPCNGHKDCKDGSDEKHCDCIKVYIGRSEDNNQKTVTARDKNNRPTDKYKCLSTANKDNLFGFGIVATYAVLYDDTFSVTQNGNKVTVRRTDKSSGWGLNLIIKCCSLEPELKNEGKDCWIGCNSKQGKCSWCGSKGMCCQRGFHDKSNGCDGSFGGSASHECVPTPSDTTVAPEEPTTESPLSSMTTEERLKAIEYKIDQMEKLLENVTIAIQNRVK